MVHACVLVGGLLMNRKAHSGAIALFCLGVLLLAAGWLGLKTPTPFTCGDETCTEAHP